jgi:hypothetical protein
MSVCRVAEPLQVEALVMLVLEQQLAEVVLVSEQADFVQVLLSPA